MVGIYKIINPKGKIYIGQTTNWDKRQKNYNILECKGQPKLYNSLKKYGSKNHKFEILNNLIGYWSDEQIQKELDELESFWINHYNSIKEGLNIKEGGIGGKHNQETKDKISKALKGRDISSWKHKIYTKERSKKLSLIHKGKKLSEETKQKISKNSKGISRNKGRKHSLEEIQKRRETRKGYKPTKEHLENMRKGMLGKNVVSIICINDNKNFSSIREAAKYYNINERSIGNILIGLAKETVQGLKFKYS